MLILVRVTDRPTTGNPQKDARNLMGGDIVSYYPDDRYMSPRMLTNPDWRIFKITDIPESALIALTDDENDDENEPVGDGFKYVRKQKLDIFAKQLPKAVKNYVNDSTRAIPILDLGAIWESTLKNYLEHRRLV